MAQSPAPIAIVGAGPAGLTLARLLEVHKIGYVVFDRDESSSWAEKRGGSGTLDLHDGLGLLAVQEAGLFEQFKALARYDSPTILANREGKVLARFGESNPDHNRPEIDRKDLRNLFLNSIPADRVRWGSKVQSAEKHGVDGSVTLRFADGHVESGFRLVVGADGAWSKIRSLVTSKTPQYSGISLLTTNIEPEDPLHSKAEFLAGNGNYMALHEGCELIVMKLRRAYYLLIGLHLPESWRSENATLLNEPGQIRQLLLREHLSGWPAVHSDLVEHSTGEFFAWPLYSLPAESLPWQHVPGVTLIGDAAHLSLQNGEGVNVAMHDSVQLAQEIIKVGIEKLDLAVTSYEDSMFPRAIEQIKNAADMAPRMMGPGTPESFYKWLLAAVGQEGHGDP